MNLFLQSVVAAIVSFALGFSAVSVALVPSTPSGFEPYPIPQRYYNQPCQKPAHLTFYDWMTVLEMPPYELNAFDCSQMSAYIEWLSENCNHRATIPGAFGDGYGHLWVMIDLGGVQFAYEPGRLPENPWVSHEEDWYYGPDTEWESIYDTPLKYALFGMEYAWWNEYPELWEVTND